MITFKFDQIFVASVCLVQSLTMMWFDEIVLFARCKECRNEALSDVSDRRQFIQIESSLLLDSLLDERHGGADEELGYFSVRRGKLVAKCPQVREWRIENHTSDAWITISME